MYVWIRLMAVYELAERAAARGAEMVPALRCGTEQGLTVSRALTYSAEERAARSVSQIVEQSADPPQNEDCWSMR